MESIRKKEHVSQSIDIVIFDTIAGFLYSTIFVVFFNALLRWLVMSFPLMSGLGFLGILLTFFFYGFAVLLVFAAPFMVAAIGLSKRRLGYAFGAMIWMTCVYICSYFNLWDRVLAESSMRFFGLHAQ